MSNPKPGRIGIDLDNTLIDYSEAARYLAIEENIDDVSSVQELRKRFRESDDEKWQTIQARLYTEGLEYARPANGCIDFILTARGIGSQLYVVSHKTMTTSKKFGGRDLRGPARAWLMRAAITPGLIPESRIFFCNSQQEKVKKVADLNLDWFIDDLQEVLAHPDFPEDTIRWLYAPGSTDGTEENPEDSRNIAASRTVLGFGDLAEFLREDSHGP